MALPKTVEEKIDLLVNIGHDSRRKITSIKGLGSRVGRNDVWQIVSEKDCAETYFAKFWRSSNAFSRELAGLELMQNLATRVPWLMAATVVRVDSATGLIVTNALKGNSLTSLISSTFRLDKCWVNEKRKKEIIFDCFRKVFGLIQLLREQEFSDEEILQDHCPTMVVSRINRTLQGLRSHNPFFNPGEISFLPFAIQLYGSSAEVAGELTHGDLSLGNVFFLDGQIGVIDFEDMGMGSPFREIIWLRHCLRTLVRNPFYRNCENLFEMLRGTEFFDDFEIIYELEFVLLEILSILQHPPLKFILKRWLLDIEKRGLIFRARQLLELGEELSKIVVVKEV